MTDAGRDRALRLRAPREADGRRRDAELQDCTSILKHETLQKNR